jgi:hypothetical protein
LNTGSTFSGGSCTLGQTLTVSTVGSGAAIERGC